MGDYSPVAKATNTKSHVLTGAFALLNYAEKWAIILVVPDFKPFSGEHYDENQRAYWRF
jgi:hypothetical protein